MAWPVILHLNFDHLVSASGMSDRFVKFDFRRDLHHFAGAMRSKKDTRGETLPMPNRVLGKHLVASFFLPGKSFTGNTKPVRNVSVS